MSGHNQGLDSFIKYYGGKFKSRDEIIFRIPVHRTYIEPFCGASWILFSKPVSQVEYINDIDSELINLYIAIKKDVSKFQKTFDNYPNSESLFNHWTGQKTPGLQIGKEPDYEQAVITYFILMNSFNGNISGKPHIGLSPDHRIGTSKYNRTDWEAIKHRLKDVGILNRNYVSVLNKLDHKDSFFYLDPPYHCSMNNRRYYRYTFNKSDMIELRSILGELKGKFLLSYDNHDEIKNLYDGFNIEELNSGDLLISNFDVQDNPYYLQGRYTNSPRVKKSSNPDHKYPNCPNCGSRDVQTAYKRKSLGHNKRTFIKWGFGCNSCNYLFD